MKKRLKKWFLPDIFADSVFDIDIDLLAKNGIRAVVFDIDNTLAPYSMPTVDEKTYEWLKMLRKTGFDIYFVSNNKKARVKRFAQSAGIPYAARAFKPCKGQLLRACRKMGVKPSEAALVGDQVFTDVCGGNRLDMFTVLVKPISVSEDWFVRLKRGFEARLLAKMSGEPSAKSKNTANGVVTNGGSGDNIAAKTGGTINSKANNIKNGGAAE